MGWGSDRGVTPGDTVFHVSYGLGRTPDVVLEEYEVVRVTPKGQVVHLKNRKTGMLMPVNAGWFERDFYSSAQRAIDDFYRQMALSVEEKQTTLNRLQRWMDEAQKLKESLK